jgi:hypothetical protein
MQVPSGHTLAVPGVTSNGDDRGTVRHPEVIEVAAVIVDAYSCSPIAEWQSLVNSSSGAPVLPSVLADAQLTQAADTAASPLPDVMADLVRCTASFGIGLNWERMDRCEAAAPTTARR